MEILLENIDLILTALVILIAAIVFARQGQISLLRELLLSIADIDRTRLYENLPKLTKMLLSNKTVEHICEETTKE